LKKRTKAKRKSPGALAFLKGPSFLMPDFPFRPFYITTFIAFIFTIFLIPVAITLDPFVESFADGIPDSIKNLSLTIFLDPIWLHLLAAIFASYLFYSISRKKRYSRFVSFSVAFTPWIILLVSEFAVLYLFKPAFDVPRPQMYDNYLEPPAVRLFHYLVGEKGSTPSGFVVRQIVLFLAISLGLNSKDSPIKNNAARISIHIVNLIFVMLVGAHRLLRDSHTLFDVTISVGVGTIVFWLVYVMPYIVFKGTSAVYNVAMVYMLFVASFFFYTNRSDLWIFNSFAVVAFILLTQQILSYFRNKEQRAYH
jgi:hypothetical protein